MSIRILQTFIKLARTFNIEITAANLRKYKKAITK